MLLTNKIYEGNLFMRYSKHLTYAERMFLRARLNRVRHITLDPDGPGVVRIHLVPCHKPDRETPFTAILNGQDILPLNVSWAILLTNFIAAGSRRSRLNRSVWPIMHRGWPRPTAWT